MGRIEELLARREDGRSNEERKKAAEATIHEVVSAIFEEAPPRQHNCSRRIFAVFQ